MHLQVVEPRVLNHREVLEQRREELHRVLRHGGASGVAEAEQLLRAQPPHLQYV